MNQINNSRHYYVSNENMSDIKESIEEYSMNFEKQSGVFGNSKSEIAQMISGSHQATQSRGLGKSKTYIKAPGGQQPAKQQQTKIGKFAELQINQVDNNEQSEDKRAVNLGEKVFQIIKERYLQVTKIETNDPQVLFDFYKSQRKQLRTMKPIKNEQIQKQMPSMQRKLIIKQQFQKILSYYEDDVYYTLDCQSQKVKKQRELQQKVEFFNRASSENKNRRISQKQISQIVDALYDPKKTFTKKEVPLSQEQKQKIQRTKFGRNLSQHYQNMKREKPHHECVQTVDKLYKFWEGIYQRQDYDIEWNQDTAKQAIERYMYEQIQDLISFAKRKLGFKCGQSSSLFKLYRDHYQKIENIFIPLNSFHEYAQVYNQVERRKQLDRQIQQKQKFQKENEKRKKSEFKKFGRPVSATPITILSKPKDYVSDLQKLAEKYPKDKLLKELITEEHLKMARYPFEYGLHDIVDEAKVKQWYKIKNLKNFQQEIRHNLSKTFVPEQVENDDNEGGQVQSLLLEQKIETDEVWKQLSSTLQEAIIVEAHEESWFRQCMIRYTEKSIGQSAKLETNQVIAKKIIKHLTDLQADQRKKQLQRIENMITASRSIAQRAKKIENLNKDSKNKQIQKQGRFLRAVLQDKAKEFMKIRKAKNSKKTTTREFLNNLFSEVMKEYKDYVTKYFNVVTGEKQCPKLLKYQFFKMLKIIDPRTLEKAYDIKNHVWVPPKQNPDNFNYKTFNLFSQFYMKDKNLFIGQVEKEQLGNTFWGRKKGKQRENLLMTYSDAKQCIFNPKLSKKP